MRVSIAAIGRMKAGPERELVARYLDRAAGSGKPLGLTGFDVSEFAESRAGDVPTRKAEEGRQLQSTVLPGGVLVTLDEHGKSLSSPALASSRVSRMRSINWRSGAGWLWTIGLWGEGFINKSLPRRDEHGSCGWADPCVACRNAATDSVNARNPVCGGLWPQAEYALAPLGVQVSHVNLP